MRDHTGVKFFHSFDKRKNLFSEEEMKKYILKYEFKKRTIKVFLANNKNMETLRNEKNEKILLKRMMDQAKVLVNSTLIEEGTTPQKKVLYRKMIPAICAGVGVSLLRSFPSDNNVRVTAAVFGAAFLRSIYETYTDIMDIQDLVKMKEFLENEEKINNFLKTALKEAIEESLPKRKIIGKIVTDRKINLNDIHGLSYGHVKKLSNKANISEKMKEI